MKIKIKLQKNVITPKRSTNGAIGYDLYIPCDTQVYQGRNILPLNFALEMPKGIEAKIEPRSGFSSKGIEGKSLPDMQGHQYTARYDADVLVGKIDPDYRGNVGVIINNHDKSFILPKGTRIAQMTFYRVELPSFEVVDELSSTERGEEGFGSTGVLSKESCKVEDDWELFIDKFDINTLKPFDKVLARDNHLQKWGAEILGFYDNESEDYQFQLVGTNWARYCIPFVGNEHLLGTTYDCDEYYKIWEE